MPYKPPTFLSSGQYLTEKVSYLAYTTNEQHIYANSPLDYSQYIQINIGKNVIPNNITFLPFMLARRFVRKLYLNCKNQWFQWAHSIYRPYNIPACPKKIYKNSGWVSWNDWLKNPL